MPHKIINNNVINIKVHDKKDKKKKRRNKKSSPKLLNKIFRIPEQGPQRLNQSQQLDTSTLGGRELLEKIDKKIVDEKRNDNILALRNKYDTPTNTSLRPSPDPIVRFSKPRDEHDFFKAYNTANKESNSDNKSDSDNESIVSIDIDKFVDDGLLKTKGRPHKVRPNETEAEETARLKKNLKQKNNRESKKSSKIVKKGLSSVNIKKTKAELPIEIPKLDKIYKTNDIVPTTNNPMKTSPPTLKEIVNLGKQNNDRVMTRSELLRQQDEFSSPRLNMLINELSNKKIDKVQKLNSDISKYQKSFL